MGSVSVVGSGGNGNVGGVRGMDSGHQGVQVQYIEISGGGRTRRALIGGH